MGSVNIGMERTVARRRLVVIHRKIDPPRSSQHIRARLLHPEVENELLLVGVADLPAVSNNSLSVAHSPFAHSPIQFRSRNST